MDRMRTITPPAFPSGIYGIALALLVISNGSTSAPPRSIPRRWPGGDLMVWHAGGCAYVGLINLGPAILEPYRADSGAFTMSPRCLKLRPG